MFLPPYVLPGGGIAARRGNQVFGRCAAFLRELCARRGNQGFGRYAAFLRGCAPAEKKWNPPPKEAGRVSFS